MTGLFIGPAPCSVLFSLMVPSNPTWQDRAIPDLILPPVPSGGLERHMYQPICDAVNNAEVCPGFKLMCVANTRDKEGCKLRPDLALVAKDVVDVNDFSVMDLWGEVKPRPDGDAFHKSYNSEDIDLDSVEKIEGKSADCRGQLISYAAAAMSRQHRVFMFSFAICGRHIRFSLWDRAGCIVTESIDYLEHPELVAEFFWRYSHMNAKERGFDVTVQRATPEQADQLTDAMETYIELSRPRNMEFLRANSDPTYSTYQLCMDNEEGKPQYFIIRQPFWNADSANGRATRAYAAYNITQNKLVFLKDCWRTEGTDIMCEAGIYKHLLDCDVPFLPEVILAGDVKVDGDEQRTFCDEWSKPDSFPEWRLPCKPLRTYVHCRIVQELAYPIASVQSSREAVQAFRDVVESIKVAYEVGDMFHRDISTGNVMISKKGRGVLNDWDHGVRLIPDREPHASRTGTWQFISMALLQKPDKSHEVRDDLESCFWVLLYVSLHYFKHNGRDVGFTLGFFDEIQERKVAGEAQYQSFGGDSKASLLKGERLNEVQWECRPLNDLIHTLAELWRTAHVLDDKLVRIIGKPQRDILLSALDKVSIVLDMFETVLASEGWKDKDAIPDQYPSVYQRNVDQAIAKEKTGYIASSVRESQAIALNGGATTSQASRRRVAAQSGIPQHYQSNIRPTAEQLAFLQGLAIPKTSCSTKRTIDNVQAGEHNVPVGSSKRMKTEDPPLSSGRRSTYEPPALVNPPTSPIKSPTRLSLPSAPTSSSARPSCPPAELNSPPAGPSHIERVPTPPAVRHRYLTRSKTKPNNVQGEDLENDVQEAPLEDVEMKQFEHRYPTRSKSNDKHPRPQRPPKPSKAQVQTVRSGKRDNKTAGKGLKHAPQEHVEPVQVEHRYPTRSKSNEKNPRPQRPPRPLNIPAQTQESVKRSNKPTASGSKRTQTKSKNRRRHR
ncbi:unnamed protein product [Somion occarium]|uniref:Fungal-type protein kinase domain-containing protein n=1 Tax=Somion occarium TaxID=3059160 RepID=A0ABP1CXG4_9APHY